MLQQHGTAHEQARGNPQDKEASWLLQFEEILYSNAPSDESKASGALNMLYADAMHALLPH